MNEIENYISGFPEEIQQRLLQLREAIREAVPEAQEVISYGMPGYKYHGMLAWFAAHKNHVGFYPTASPIVAFRDELKSYQTSKGAVQFPNEKPIPLDLVKSMVSFKVDENLQKARRKGGGGRGGKEG